MYFFSFIIMNILFYHIYNIVRCKYTAFFMNYQRESVKIMLFWEKYPLKVFSFRILFVSLGRISSRGVSCSIWGFPITLWVNKSIRYYSRSAKSIWNFHGYNVTRIICDRVSVNVWMPLTILLAMQSRNRRDAFLWMVWGFLPTLPQCWTQ